MKREKNLKDIAGFNSKTNIFTDQKYKLMGKSKATIC